MYNGSPFPSHPHTDNPGIRRSIEIKNKYNMPKAALPTLRCISILLRYLKEFIAEKADHGIYNEQKQQQHADVIVYLYGGIYDSHDKP